MKAIIETISGMDFIIEINLTDTPTSIIKQFYKDEVAEHTQFLCNQDCIDELMNNDLDDGKNFFGLISIEGDDIPAKWNIPLNVQPDITDEIVRIESNGQLPKFFFHINCFSRLARVFKDY